MKKNDYLKALKETGVVATLEEGKELLEKIDKAIEIAVSEEGKTKVGTYFTVEKVHVEAKSGVCNGVDYTKNAHDEIQVKRTSICKDIK